MTGSAALSRLRGSDRESGFTLVELLVAIVVLAILLTIVGSLFLTSVRTVSASEATGQATGTASNAINELSRVIRSGTPNAVVGQLLPDPPFVAATTESLTMYSYVDSYTGPGSTQVRPLLVQFSLDGARRLVEKRWVPSTSDPGYFVFPTPVSNPTTTPVYSAPTRSALTIAGPIAATPSSPAGSAPLFSYLDADGNTLTPSATGLTSTQLGEVARVLVTIRVAGAASSTRPTVVLQNTVRIPNLGLTGG